MKQVGIYGGTFNPIHFGHLSLAIEILEKHGLDHIYFCPAALSPHKVENLPLAAEHRVEMVKLAIQDIPQFSVLENELKREAPSYTIDTILELLEGQAESLDKAQFSLIIGADALPNLHRWHRIHEIVKLVPLLVGMRQFENFNKEIMYDPLLKNAIQKGKTSTRILEMSSTEIRERLHQNKYCGHLVPAKVLDYIYTNRLY